MYGNFCGPYWSDGRFQPSVEPTVEAIDELDDTCRQHDRSYARGEDLQAADFKFFKQNFGNGLLATAMAIPVGIQGALRTSDKPTKLSTKQSNTMTKKNLRGSKPVTRTGDDTKRMAPVSIATKRVGIAPRITNKPSGTIEVSHRSFLAPVDCSAAFTVEQFYANPGLPGTFPWLAKLARRYEEYRFKRLRFEYRSVCSTGTNGVIMMSFDYDAADGPPMSKAAQAQSIPNSEINAWSGNDLAIPCDSPWKYVRAGDLPPNLDIKTYDLGVMNLSSLYGNGTITGELYVEYTVELRKPTDGPTTSGRVEYGTGTFTAPFTTQTAIGGFLPFRVTSSNELLFTQPGEFVITVTTTGTGFTASPQTPAMISVSGGVVTSLFGTASSNIGSRGFKVRANIGDTLVFSNVGVGTTLTSTILRASSADYDSV